MKCKLTIKGVGNIPSSKAVSFKLLIMPRLMLKRFKIVFWLLYSETFSPGLYFHSFHATWFNFTTMKIKHSENI
jgi:hypothetical protein